MRKVSRVSHASEGKGVTCHVVVLALSHTHETGHKERSFSRAPSELERTRLEIGIRPDFISITRSLSFLLAVSQILLIISWRRPY